MTSGVNLGMLQVTDMLHASLQERGLAPNITTNTPQVYQSSAFE